MSRSRKKKKGGRGAGLFILVIFLFWFLTGWPFPPKWIEVEVITDNPPYGVSAPSWREIVVPDEIFEWGRQHGIQKTFLEAAFKAAALERNPTGKPERGTGQRIDPFIILAIMAKESSITATDNINPTIENPTGRCLAWRELKHHRLLNGLAEINALRNIVRPLGYSWEKVYGSCGGGAIGWSQALPSNWWRLMGPGFNPWSPEDAAEFVARYLGAHGYFTHGIRYAVKAYNPRAPDAIYTEPILKLSEQLRQSFEISGLSAEVQLGTERVILQQPFAPPKITLSQMPVEGARVGTPFGVPSRYQPRGHTGIDFDVPEGTPVKAAGPGRVVFVGWWPQSFLDKTLKRGHGNTVWIWHGYYEGKPVYTVYAHLSSFMVRKGDYVKEGEVIGLSGNTGASGGPHLHFAVRVGGGVTYEGVDEYGSWEGRWEDPDKWIAKRELETDFTDLSKEFPIPTTQATSTNQRPTKIIMRETPVLKIALEMGEVVRLAKKISNLARREREIVTILGEIHTMFSTWAIAGQPHALGLYPGARWRLFYSD